MAPSAVSLETLSAEFGPKNSKEAVVEQPKRAVHGAEDLTPIQAISHGPITIGGTYFSLFLNIVSYELYEHSIKQACKNLWFHLLPFSFDKFMTEV